ncbi:MAG: hypothetical protein ACRDBO_16210 [Lachnospiraceae bacterium]
MEELFAKSISDEKGIFVERDIWRKGEIIQVNHAILVAAKGAGYFYSMEFCSEDIDAGKVKAKRDDFCQCVQDALAYGREKLK